MSKKLIAGAGVVASFAIALAPLATFATDEAGTKAPNAQKDILSVTLEEVCAFGYTSTNGVTVLQGKHTDGTRLSGDANQTDTVLTDKTAGKSFGKWDDTALDGAYDGRGATDVTTDDAADTDTAYAIMENGTVNTTFAKTQLNIVCNNLSGYRLSAVATNLADVNAATNNNTDNIAYSRVAPAITDSTWSFYLTDVTTTGITDTTHEVAATATPSEGQYKLEASGATRTIIASAFDSTIETTSTEPLYNVIAHSNGATSKTGDRYEITYGVSVDSALPAGTYQGNVVYTLAQIAN